MRYCEWKGSLVHTSKPTAERGSHLLFEYFSLNSREHLGPSESETRSEHAVRDCQCLCEVWAALFWLTEFPTWHLYCSLTFPLDVTHGLAWLLPYLGELPDFKRDPWCLCYSVQLPSWSEPPSHAAPLHLLEFPSYGKRGPSFFLDLRHRYWPVSLQDDKYVCESAITINDTEQGTSERYLSFWLKKR